MVALGSHILNRLLPDADQALQAEIREQWDTLAIAWPSTTADRRVALTRLQAALASWTAEDAHVADDAWVQRYRRQLHLVLDH
jgi:hypothetical protein